MIRLTTFYKGHELTVEETTEGCFEESLREATRAINKVLENKEEGNKEKTNVKDRFYKHLDPLVVAPVVDDVVEKVNKNTVEGGLRENMVSPTTVIKVLSTYRSILLKRGK